MADQNLDRIIGALQERLSTLETENHELAVKHNYPPFPLPRSLINLNRERSAASEPKVALTDYLSADWITACFHHSGVIERSSGCRVDPSNYRIEYLKG